MRNALSRFPAFLFAVLVLVATAAVAVAAPQPLVEPHLALCIEWFDGVVMHTGTALASIPAIFGLRNFGPRFDKPDDSGNDPAPSIDRDEILNIVKGFLAGKTGDEATAAIAQKMADSEYRARTAEAQYKALQKQVADLKGKVPDGAVVLTGDEAAAYNEIKEKAGDQFSMRNTVKALDAGAKAIQSEKTRIAEESTMKALEGFVNPKLLKQMVDHDKIEWERVGEGKDAKLFGVIEKDGTKVRKAHDELIKEAYPEAASLLLAPAKGTNAPTTPPVQAGTFVAQHPTSGAGEGGSSDPIQRRLERREQQWSRQPAKPAEAAV